MTLWAPATSPQTTSPEFWSMHLAAQVGVREDLGAKSAFSMRMSPVLRADSPQPQLSLCLCDPA